MNGYAIMAWLESEAIAAGELLCIESIGEWAIAGKSYPIQHPEHGFNPVLGLEAGLKPSLHYLSLSHNHNFKIEQLQLEND